MRFERRFLFLTLALVMATNAHADFVTVQFSYTFADGKAIVGTAQGDLLADGDYVEVSSLNAVYTGQPDTPLTFLFTPPVGYNVLTLSGSQDFYFLGFASDPKTTTQTPNFGFLVSRSPGVRTNDVTVGPFLTSSSFVQYPSVPPFGDSAVEWTPFVRSAWSASIVPEPSSLALIACGLVAPVLTLARRRRTA